MAKTRFFYALSDSFTGDTPKEVTHGFANTKVVIAFRTKAARLEWLQSTNLMTARPLTRERALVLSEKAYFELPVDDVTGEIIEEGDRYVRMARDSDNNNDSLEFLIVRKNRRRW